MISRFADPLRLSPPCNMQVQQIWPKVLVYHSTGKQAPFRVVDSHARRRVLAPGAATIIIMELTDTTSAAALWAFHPLFKSEPTRWPEAAKNRAKADKGRRPSLSPCHQFPLTARRRSDSFPLWDFRGHGQFPQVFVRARFPRYPSLSATEYGQLSRDGLTVSERARASIIVAERTRETGMLAHCISLTQLHAGKRRPPRRSHRTHAIINGVTFYGN